MAHAAPRPPKRSGRARTGARTSPSLGGRPRSPSSEPGVNAMTTQHYDVIIIGTGAGGGTLAHKLASSGKRILLLERGGYLPREPENWDSKEVFGKDRYVTREVWHDKNGEAFRPHAQYFVGGNTKFYGAIL